MGGAESMGVAVHTSQDKCEGDWVERETGEWEGKT